MNHHAERVSLLARRLTVELEEFSRAFAITHKLNSTDMRALVLIMDAYRLGSPMNASMLSEQLGVTNASVTTLLDRLHKADHITRKPHPTDRRSLVIVPSAHAEEVGRQYYVGLQQAMHSKLAEFTDTELLHAEQILGAMIDVAAEQQRSVRRSGRTKS